MAEVFPSLCSRAFAREDRNEHQHDAFSVAEWMRCSDLDGTLAGFWLPLSRLRSAKQRTLRAGYWELDEDRLRHSIVPGRMRR